MLNGFGYKNILKSLVNEIWQSVISYFTITPNRGLASFSIIRFYSFNYNDRTNSTLFSLFLVSLHTKNIFLFGEEHYNLSFKSLLPCPYYRFMFRREKDITACVLFNGMSKHCRFNIFCCMLYLNLKMNAEHDIYCWDIKN